MSLYERMTELQGTLPWGALLDAGSGRASLRWLLTQDTTRWTAVTAAPRMLDIMRREAGTRLRPQDRLLLGNWLDPALLAP